MYRALTRLGPVAAMLVAVATASPAVAQTNVSTYSATGNSLGTFAATSSPEQIAVNDRAADGHSAVVQIRLDSLSSNNIEYWNPNGAGTTAVASVNLAENRVVWVRACEGEFGTRSVLAGTCSDWKKGVA